VGAIPELLEGSAAGLLVPPGAPDALADAIERGLTLKTDEASRRARRVLTERSSLDGRASAHLRLYHQLLQGRAP
jgi:glycosyltransferase involved in cell wall biosynthesis